MEDVENQDVENDVMGSSDRTRVGFPQVPKKESKSPKRLLLLIIVALIVGGGLFWWFKFGKEGDSITLDGPTPTTGFIEELPSPTETVLEVDKKEISIQVLNGSGITGAASSLAKKLEGLGYSGIKTGNADNSDYKETEVSVIESIPGSVKSEIQNLLENNFADVTLSRSKPTKFDIEIIIGYPKGHTPTPSSKPKSTSTPSPTGKVTGTITPIVSPSVTSTPTPTP